MKILVKVSVIMPVYNKSELLEQSIKSILKQSLNDLEIICIDCDSNKESKNILKTFSEKFNCIKIFNQDKISLGEARNYGMEKCNGKYISFINTGDVFADENALEILSDVGEKNNVSMICGNIKYPFNEKTNLENLYYFDKFFKINPEKYGIPVAFYKNIYEKSFLETNDIKFEDSNNYQDPVFLSKILTKLDVIYGTPLEFYSHDSNLLNIYGELKSHIEKLHHLNHFKETFNIFNKYTNFNTISEKFKQELMDYFNFSIKINDLEIYEISLSVFGKTPEYFQNIFKNQFNLFLSHHMVHKISLEGTEEFFQESKTDLISLKLLDNELLNDELLRTLILILNSDNYEIYSHKLHDFKLNLTKSKNEDLISEKDLLKNKRDELNRVNKKLRKSKDTNKENIDLKNKNKELLESNKKLSEDYERLINKNSTTPEDYEKLINENEKLFNENTNLKNENSNLTSDKKKLLNQNINLKKTNKKLKNELNVLTVTNKNLEQNIKKMNKEKEQFLSSRSWKVASNLRSIKNKF